MVTDKGGSRADAPLVVVDRDPLARWRGDAKSIVSAIIAVAQKEYEATEPETEQQNEAHIVCLLAHGLRAHLAAMPQAEPCWNGRPQGIAECDETCPCFLWGRERGIEEAREAGL